MKKLITLTLIGLIGYTGWSQEEQPADTTVIKLKNKQIIIKDIPLEDIEEPDKDDDKNKADAHWAGLDIGVNTLVNASNKVAFDDARFLEINPAKSWNWNLNFAEHRFSLFNEYIGITTGLGLNITNFTFKNNYIYNYNADSITATMDTVISYDKNKLRLTYLTVPLLLEFNSNKNSDKNFYLSAGVVAGVNVISKLKRQSDQEGYEVRFSEKGDYGVNPFKLDAMLRMGFSDWGLYASYNILPVFDTDLTETAHHASFGLTFSF